MRSISPFAILKQKIADCLSNLVFDFPTFNILFYFPIADVRAA